MDLVLQWQSLYNKEYIWHRTLEDSVFLSVADNNTGEFLDFIEGAFTIDISGNNTSTEISVIDCNDSLKFKIEKKAVHK